MATARNGTQSTQPNVPKFTLDQVEWLEKAFPENINTNSDANALFINLGERRVIKRIRSICEDNLRAINK